MLKQRFLRIGLAKIGSKIQNLEIFQKSPNVVFSVKMTTFNFWGQSQFRSKGASKIIFRILRGKGIRFFGYLLKNTMFQSLVSKKFLDVPFINLELNNNAAALTEPVGGHSKVKCFMMQNNAQDY